MFEQLFGSKTRAKLIKLFIENPDKAFYVRELTRLTDSMINSIRRELKILEDMNIVFVDRALIDKNIKDMNLPEGLNTKKFYKLNTDNVFHEELKMIFEKNDMVAEKNLVDEVKDIDSIYLAVLVGKFIKDDPSPTDALIVASTGREKIEPVIEILQDQLAEEMNYTIFTPDEYALRRDINDRFLYAILNNVKKIVLIDKTDQIK
ncbi:MAG TPA: hypothetical protein VMX18_01120 [Candidatus Bipolaricaulota bacterium]|nr:hypothetical protein [Candidatus Bipolaricaulota bacterium]